MAATIQSRPKLHPSFFPKDEAPDFPKATACLKKGADIDAPRFKGNLTFLHWAALKGKILVLNYLLDHGASIDITDEMHSTALHIAVAARKTIAAQTLIRRGANVNALIPTNHLTVLHFAVQKKCREIVEILLEAKALITANKSGATPLHFAARMDEAGIAKQLLAANADVNAQTVEGMTTPLHIAVEFGSEEVLPILLDYGADPNIPNAAGPPSAENQKIEGPRSLIKKEATPLHIAVVVDDESAIEQLLAAKADVNAKTIDGQTALHLAVLCNLKHITSLLIKEDADPSIEDAFGHTSSQLAAQRPEMSDLKAESSAARRRSFDFTGIPLQLSAADRDEET
ncbi:MAG: Phosphocholine transferase AnkX [Chlamydiae bacterium]|nr:Phosphocholine transferase AnkX [Chlamydiota bacterium]